jgi:hypothetical protein
MKISLNPDRKRVRSQNHSRTAMQRRQAQMKVSLHDVLLRGEARRLTSGTRSHVNLKETEWMKGSNWPASMLVFAARPQGTWVTRPRKLAHGHRCGKPSLVKLTNRRLQTLIGSE